MAAASAALKYTENLALVRNIQRELRLAIKGAQSKKPASDASIQHMLALMRENQVTERRYCRPADNYKYLGETYLAYLRSSRVEGELVNKYFNKGERSVRDSARLVGLDLPKQTSS